MKIFTAILLLSACCCFGQTTFEDIEYLDEPVWAAGKLTLNDGTELEGIIKYDNKTGEIAFRNASVSKILTPRNVLDFEFTDRKTRRRRFFYYLEIAGEAGNSTPIFEVMRSYETFAVLSRIEPVQPVKVDNFLNQRQIGGAAADPVSATGFTQRETIWFLPADGKPTIYLDLLYTSYFKSRNDKVEDKDIFEKCTGSLYPAIKSFARRNNLSFANKHHLLRMLDFYELQLARK
jgi:hypothetical protein